MAIEIVMPRLGWNMEVGTVVEWLKHDGDRVNIGDYIFMVEGDKSVSEVEALDSGMGLAEAEQLVLDYVRQFVPEPRRAPLAGNTIGTDRMFLARDMPAFEQYVHYRSVDVSSIKELARRWYPRAYYQAPAKSGNHRALADVQESIEELRYYRDAVFVPRPGPDSATAKEIADRHQGALTGAVVDRESPDN